MYKSTSVKGLGLRLNDLGYKNYREYMASKHWSEFKSKVYSRLRKRNQIVCEFCRKSDLVLHVHHKTYKRLGNELIGDVFLLCQECHTAVHCLEKSKGLTLWQATKLCGRKIRRSQKQQPVISKQDMKGIRKKALEAHRKMASYFNQLRLERK